MAQKYVPVFLFLFRTRHLLLKFERSSHPSSMLHLQFLSHRSPQVHFLLNLKTLHIALSYLHKLQEYHSDNEMLIIFLYFLLMEDMPGKYPLIACINPSFDNLILYYYYNHSIDLQTKAYNYSLFLLLSNIYTSSFQDAMFLKIAVNYSLMLIHFLIHVRYAIKRWFDFLPFH